MTSEGEGEWYRVGTSSRQETGTLDQRETGLKNTHKSVLAKTCDLDLDATFTSALSHDATFCTCDFAHLDFLLTLSWATLRMRPLLRPLSTSSTSMFDFFHVLKLSASLNELYKKSWSSAAFMRTLVHEIKTPARRTRRASSVHARLSPSWTWLTKSNR